MSYCRFSSLDGQCDLYVYDSVCGGLTIHVATKRREVKEPFPPNVQMGDGDDWVDRYMARINEVDRINKEYPLKKIGLPHDGQTFTFGADYESCAQMVEKLASLGYRVPDWIASDLLEETNNPQGESEE